MKKLYFVIAAGLAALSATLAFAADPITEFLLHSDRATVSVPDAPALTQSKPALQQKLLDVEVNPKDDAFQLEAPFKGGKVATETVAARFRDVRGLMLRVCQQPSNQAYFSKTPCIASELTDAQASDSAKASPAEVKAANRVFQQIAAINDKTRQMMIASGVDAHEAAVKQSEAQIDPKVKANQDALISGKISWGEYNRTRMTLTRRAR
ncbi:hypothetical protein [Mesosutterella multiformis]|jgi:hypothetical protein|uniref:hypothetical protein n=1 Tax=Mesosutterella multiformis TaxID=2259133 RepID=UPI000E4BBC64|nr:hypothetical protein [Mesosutterella multiformis]RGU80524.1 hypothetical protein DWW46_01165 [Sutterella sp. AF15-45LB]RGU81366.1 hypothetical protein DWW45_00885 [Sutterella sp. AF15-44LB]RHH05672.1 hypothetical protein DW229_08140 [Sutterella sp. AM18-8-1]GCB32732.1 hypothetical protein KGMB02707_20010 [Mesosutterella multiformis]